MNPQRVREAEIRAGTGASNGPLRARGKGNEYGATGERRYGSGVCRHSAEGTGQTVKQGGSAEIFSSLTSNCQGLFVLPPITCKQRRERRPRRSGGCDAQASCPHSPGPARLGECNKVFCKPAPYFAQLCLTMVPSESKIAFGIVCCPGLAPAALL